eukprot:snap_masked-scaffold_4-processed-gene-2.20-mRNA-1 protein AED:1.00 eAED:1.00 QI:0/0/0/0/1/1/3/0/69
MIFMVGSLLSTFAGKIVSGTIKLQKVSKIEHIFLLTQPNILIEILVWVKSKQSHLETTSVTCMYGMFVC